MSSRKYTYKVRVKLVRERAGDFGPAMNCAADVAELLRDELVSLDREQIFCLHLDVKNRLISRETVSTGTLSSAICHPREIFKAALLANAASVVLAHNHPSGDPEPSREDIELTRRLIRVGLLLGVPVLDHVVVAEDGFRSIAAGGLS